MKARDISLAFIVVGVHMRNGEGGFYSQEVGLMKSTARIFLFLSLVVLAFAMVAGCARMPFSKPLGREPRVTIFEHKTGQKRSLGMEEYIMGVVAAEIPATAPTEALKAQSVLARTFTLEKLSRGGVRAMHGTDVCDSPEHFQAYDAGRVTPAVRDAVNSTRGVIVTYAGKPIKGWFHSYSGGKTATAKEGLAFKEPEPPYIKVVNDVPATKDTKWTAEFGQDELVRAARKLGANVTNAATVAIGEKGPSGRAVSILIGGTPVSAPELRIALGSDRMRSTLLDSITVSSDRVVMSGRGWGHGVGLSQEGSFTLAGRGKKAEEILKFYFRGIKAEKRWR